MLDISENTKVKISRRTKEKGTQKRIATRIFVEGENSCSLIGMQYNEACTSLF